ncbi:MAG: hypothetical protein PF638_16295 [Candidatus Delongbacteria bacterium]|jgi:hypothetical protein|nr:hypothetical protein [Candidatus Delongbacteria bacterium]
MKKQKKAILGVLFLLLTSILAMSDDGEKEAIKGSKIVNQEITPNGDFVQSTTNDKQTQATISVKDKYGVDTGMSSEKLATFKEEYMKLDRKMFPNSRTTMLYDAKIDLNKYDEFKKHGVDLKRSGAFVDAKTYMDNALYSEIIVTGITIKPERLDNANTFKLEIDEVIKGKEILINKFGDVPKFINYYDDTDVVGTTKPIMNLKGIYYFNFSQNITPSRRWIQKRPESTLLLLPDSTILYEKYYDDFKSLKWLRSKKNKSEQNKIWQKGFEKTIIMNETWNEAVNNVKTILKINDANNFYNKKFKAEVEK